MALPSPFQVVLLPAILYQNILLLRFPVWYAARFPTRGQQATPTSFTSLITSFDNEWKMVIATSTIFLGSNLGIFQLSGTMTDIPLRTMGFLSMAFASVSIMYGVILILCLSVSRFEPSTTAEDRNAAERRILDDTENERFVWWNVSILFALPVIWTSWSALNFVGVLLLLLWHVKAEAPTKLMFQNMGQTSPRSTTHAVDLMPNVAVTVVLAIGGGYLVLMIRTLRSLSLHDDHPRV